MLESKTFFNSNDFIFMRDSIDFFYPSILREQEIDWGIVILVSRLWHFMGQIPFSFQKITQNYSFRQSASFAGRIPR